MFAAEGVRAVEELVRSSIAIRGILAAPQLADAPRGAALLAAIRQRGADLSEVSALEFASAAETESPQGVLAIAEIPEIRLDALPVGDRLRIVVLDAVQDPGNVGTILRTAAALGASATLALPGTVDLWNAKVVRSAMGALFHHPAVTCTWNELDAFRSARALALWGADAAGELVSQATGDRTPRLILAVGIEGGGLSAECRARADRFVALPIAADVESLNAAVAAGILLYTLRD